MKAYFIEARTGCSCCRSENFERGPYKETDKSMAEETIAQWSKGEGNPLASQYAKYGRYTLREYEAEEISGGRLIIGNAVWGPGIEERSLEEF